MGSQKVRHNWATSLSTYIGSKSNFRISLQVQWLRLHASTAGCKGSIPVWGTKILHVTWCDQKLKKKINSFIIILNQADRLPISHKNDLPLTPFSYVMIQFLIWKHISLLLTVLSFTIEISFLTFLYSVSPFKRLTVNTVTTFYSGHFTI